MEVGERPSEIKLVELYISIQVYDLPIDFNFEFILKSKGKCVGRFISLDPKKFKDGGGTLFELRWLLMYKTHLKVIHESRKRTVNGNGLILNMNNYHPSVFIVD